MGNWFLACGDAQYKIRHTLAMFSKIYRRSFKTTRIHIAHRDQGDAETLALALTRPRWINDKDFGVTGVQTLTTAELLAILFPKISMRVDALVYQ